MTKIGNKVCCPIHNFLYRTYLIISCTELDGKNDYIRESSLITEVNTDLIMLAFQRGC